MGYVYILTNKSYKYGWFRRKLLKIGKTLKDPKERAKELSGTSVPTPFEVAYFIESYKYDEIEYEMHSRLDRYRSEKNREFFKYPVRKAIKLLDKIDIEFSTIEILRPIEDAPRSIEDVNSNSRIDGSKLLLDPLKVSNVDSIPKLAENGEPYYSTINGFYEAVNARGMPAAIRPHITIIIDNEELEVRASQENLESQLDILNDQLEQLEIAKVAAEEEVVESQNNITDIQQTLEELKAIDSLETTIDEKIEKCNNQEIEFAELQAELKKFPPDDGTSRNRQLTLYPVFGVFCLILSLALYFFYISALDKGFFTNIDLENSDMTSYASLNELFDSTAFLRAFEKANIWLILFPIFPLGLALVIHPFWTSAVKQWGLRKILPAIFSVVGIFVFLGLTLVFDSILALQISKKIHESKVIMGLSTGEWTINPIDPFTWDLNIVLVLFCGFFVSVLLSILFHFTLEMWKEARIQNVNDRNTISMEKDRLEVEIKNAKDEIERLSDNLQIAKQKIESISDSVLIKAQITGLEKEKQNSEDQIEENKKKVQNIQADLQQREEMIAELQVRKNKRLIDLVKLRAQIDEFLVGWNRFLAAEGNSAEDSIDKAREIAYEIFNKHFNQEGQDGKTYMSISAN